MSGRPDTWMPMYWGDYVRDTGHLNAAGHGAYLMLIKHYWCTGSPLADDDDELWRIACCDSKKEWLKVRPKIVRLFVPGEGLLRHKRIDKELAKAANHMDAKAEAGKLGAQKRWQKDGTPIADLSVCHRQNDAPSPSPSPSQEEAAAATFLIQEEAPRAKPAVNGHRPGGRRMPRLDSPWSAWEWLTNGEIEIVGANAERRPCAGGFYLDEVARMVCDAAGIDGNSGSIDWSPIVAWLRAGIGGDVIAAAIKRVAARDGYEPKMRLSYFDKPVREAKA